MSSRRKRSVGWKVLVSAPALLGLIAWSAVASEDQGKTSVVAEPQKFCVELERSGTFVPAKATVIELWPQAYSGELLVMEAVPHGSPVNEGDVIARLWTRPIDEQLQQAELDLDSTRIAHENTVERAEIDEQAAREALENARASLERAQRAFEGYEQHELAFRARSAEMSEMWARHSIEDQEDELAQLEAMYREDELTDATEEIVLKRSRRDLARSRESFKMQQDRRKYEVAFSEAIQTAAQREAVKNQKAGLERLMRSQELERRARRDGLVRSEDSFRKKREHLERLRQDRELFTIRAPRSGVLLHGSPGDYEPGKVAPRYEKGSTARTRTGLFTIHQPGKLEVAIDIPEPKMATTHPGMAAKIRTVYDPAVEVIGALRTERFPSAASAGAGENSYAARVEFDAPLPGIQPGMRAKVAIVLEALEGVIVLPKAAVFGTGDEAHCYVARAGSEDFQEVAVKLGPSNEKEIVITEGVTAGDRVLLSEPGA
ncbi:MAG: hypothetical protein AB1486_18990 [Planctomycetota bacterium]